MALSDIIIPRREIQAFNSSFAVRPLCVDDVTRALFDAQDDVKAASDLYKQIVGDRQDEEAMAEFLFAVIDTLPQLAARIVAYACDEPDKWETALKLPLPIQTDAVFAIFELTFVEPDSLKKFLGQLKSVTTLATKK